MAGRGASGNPALSHAWTIEQASLQVRYGIRLLWPIPAKENLLHHRQQKKETAPHKTLTGFNKKTIIKKTKKNKNPKQETPDKARQAVSMSEEADKVLTPPH